MVDLVGVFPAAAFLATFETECFLLEDGVCLEAELFRLLLVGGMRATAQRGGDAPAPTQARGHHKDEAFLSDPKPANKMLSLTINLPRRVSAS